MENRPVRVWSMAEGDMAYWTYRTEFAANELLLWGKGIVPLAGAHFDIGQVHPNIDVTEEPLLVHSVGRIANNVLGGHFARHRLHRLVHSIGERGSVTAGPELQGVVAFVRGSRQVARHIAVYVLQWRDHAAARLLRQPDQVVFFGVGEAER